MTEQPTHVPIAMVVPLGAKYTATLPEFGTPGTPTRLDVAHGLGTEWITNVLVTRKVDVVITNEVYSRGTSKTGWAQVLCNATVIGTDLVRLEFADAIPADTYRVVISA